MRLARERQRTDLVGMWLAVESAYQRTMIAQHTAALQATKRANETPLRRAQKTLAAGTPPRRQ